MKKKSLLVLFGTLMIALAISSVVSASLPGSGWWTSYSVQNVGSSDGVLEMQAFDSISAAVIGSSPFAFDEGTALVYDPGKAPNYSTGGNIIGFDSTLPSGFVGSVVLSGDVPMAAAAQVSNFRNGSVGTTSGAASGMYQASAADQTGLELLFPLVKNNWSNATTTFYIQAAGQDANVTMTFNMNDGSSYPVTQLIGENKMFVFNPTAAGVPSTNCGNNFNTSPCFGAAVATSDTPIAGVVIEHPHVGSPIGAILSTRGMTAADSDTVLFAPSIKHDYFDAVAGATVMNIGSQPADVDITITVTFGPNAGTVYTDSVVIQPGSSQTFSKWLNNIGGMPRGNFGAARIESTNGQPLLGISNDSKAQARTPMGFGRTASYLFSISGATSKNSAPSVKEYAGVYTGGQTVVNVGTLPTTLKFTYYEYGSSNVYEFTTANPVAPNAAVNTGVISNNPGGAFVNDGSFSFSQLRNKEFSVIIESLDGQPIVNLVTAYDPASRKFYDIMNYEGFSLIP